MSGTLLFVLNVPCLLIREPPLLLEVIRQGQRYPIEPGVLLDYSTQVVVAAVVCPWAHYCVTANSRRHHNAVAQFTNFRFHYVDLRCEISPGFVTNHSAGQKLPLSRGLPKVSGGRRYLGSSSQDRCGVRGKWLPSGFAR
jgi:hypothetical protein